MTRASARLAMEAVGLLFFFILIAWGSNILARNALIYYSMLGLTLAAFLSNWFKTNAEAEKAIGNRAVERYKRDQRAEE